MSVEENTRWIINTCLANKGWILDPDNAGRNVFFEGDVPDVELNKKLKQLGLRPDYILWNKETNTPLGIIEAKRGGGIFLTHFLKRSSMQKHQRHHLFL